MDLPDREKLKASALMAGYLKDCVVRKEPTTPTDMAGELAGLVAALTSVSLEVREAAKVRVRELARIGGWQLEASTKKVTAKAISKGQQKKTGEPTPKRPFRWSIPEEERLYTAWGASDSERDGPTILRLAESFLRSPLAIIIRLYQLGAFGIEKGDELCRAVGAVRLLSECEAQRDNPSPAPIPSSR